MVIIMRSCDSNGRVFFHERFEVGNKVSTFSPVYFCFALLTLTVRFNTRGSLWNSRVCRRFVYNVIHPHFSKRDVSSGGRAEKQLRVAKKNFTDKKTYTILYKLI